MTNARMEVGRRILMALWVAAVVATSVQATVLHNNNFEIFRTSWFNLIESRDLYATSPRHFDFFLYTPTFAVLFAPLAVMPFWLGLLLWNALNAVLLYSGLGLVLSPEDAFVARSIVFMDTIGNMQNAQSNALVAGLLIIAFAQLERHGEFRASLAIALGTMVKIFPVLASTFAIFRPSRLPRFALYSGGVFLVLVTLPLLFMSPGALLHQYRSWMTVQGADEGGYSIMQHLRLWFGIEWPNAVVQVIGLTVLVAPIVRQQRWTSLRFRLLYLASLLMFVVLFNHGAESPSFVIAVAGVAIWFVVSNRGWFPLAVLGIVIVGTVLSSSDAMPAFLRVRVFQPYRIKTMPILLVWIVTQVDLWSRSVPAPHRAHESAGVAPAT